MRVGQVPKIGLG